VLDPHPVVEQRVAADVGDDLPVELRLDLVLDAAADSATASDAARTCRLTPLAYPLKSLSFRPVIDMNRFNPKQLASTRSVPRNSIRSKPWTVPVTEPAWRCRNPGMALSFR
jgi:hypothetical protein